MGSSSLWQSGLSVAAILSHLDIISASPLSPRALRGMVYDWASVAPSSTLEWTPCFDNFTCARLEVPLDYGNPKRGNTAVAIVKYPAQNITEETQNLVINTGGPGGVNTDFVIAAGPVLGQVIGTQHNIVGFDTRGVGHSGPVVDCWPNHPERRAQFEKLFYPDVSYASSNSLETQFYAADLFGKACTPTVGGSDGNASFVSTPAVAHDLLTYINAEQVAAGKSVDDAKLTFYGLSYGTALGVTFASLFPDHVGRLVLDGVLDASDYYDLEWKHNLDDADKAIDSFCKYCHQGGPQNCSFWGPSVKNITDRLNGLLADLKHHPIPIPSSQACELPMLATYSDLKEYALEAMYSPLSGFPTFADVLSGLEKGNTTAYMYAVTDGTIPANPCNNGTVGTTEDVNTLIKCVDGYGGHKFQNISQYRDYVETLTSQSKFFGEVWPNNANNVACRSVEVEPPQSAKLPGSIFETKKTSFPILFVTAEIDPVTPKRNAEKMSSVFPGSVVLTQASVGHTAMASASTCLLENVQAYLGGQLPPANTTCQPDVLPFQGSGISFLG